MVAPSHSIFRWPQGHESRSAATTPILRRTPLADFLRFVASRGRRAIVPMAETLEDRQCLVHWGSEGRLRTIGLFLLLLTALTCFGIGSARAAMLDSSVAVTDPATLQALERGGLSITRLLGPALGRGDVRASGQDRLQRLHCLGQGPQILQPGSSPRQPACAPATRPIPAARIISAHQVMTIWRKRKPAKAPASRPISSSSSASTATRAVGCRMSVSEGTVC